MEFCSKIINMDFCADCLVVLLQDTPDNKVVTLRIDNK